MLKQHEQVNRSLTGQASPGNLAKVPLTVENSTKKCIAFVQPQYSKKVDRCNSKSSFRTVFAYSLFRFELLFYQECIV